MQVCRAIAVLRQSVRAARAAGRRVGFVPTMGALHAGHASLITAARQAGGFTVVSIFVNPTQFGPGEDFGRYPRSEAADLQLCEKLGADAVFLPPPAEMYPQQPLTTVRVAQLTDTLCGPFRPGHFDGVATVVAKLLNIVQPDAAWFGEKDAQQLAVVRRLVADLDLPVEIVGCATLREPDGLALSSRNQYLNSQEREQAVSLYRALSAARALLLAGERDPGQVEQLMRRTIMAAGPASIDYASVVDAATLQQVQRVSGPVLLALAVRIGNTRLIDNVRVEL